MNKGLDFRGFVVSHGYYGSRSASNAILFENGARKVEEIEENRV